MCREISLITEKMAITGMGEGMGMGVGVGMGMGVGVGCCGFDQPRR